MSTTNDRASAQALLAYAAFILIGISAGIGGVLLPAQIDDYDLTRTVIGLMFFAFAAGFLVSGMTVGHIVHRYGIRASLTFGTAVMAVTSLGTATRPAFPALLAIQAVAGFGLGVMESALNSHMSTMRAGARRLNLLHAYFGVGALIGPLLATWLLRSHDWPFVWLVIGIATLPFVVGFFLLFPAVPEPTELVSPANLVGEPPGLGVPPPQPEHGLLGAALRQRGIVLAAVFLTIYVGLEFSLGSWGYSYLVEERGRGDVAAGWAVSGFWFGLAAGRFVIGPLVDRLGWDALRQSTACLAAVLVASVVVWLSPWVGVATIGFLVIGFFLGPLFPTTMAVIPHITEPRLVTTAMGLLNGASVIGGALLPWLAGALGQGIGMWTLLPYVAALAALELFAWARVSRYVVGRVSAGSLG